MQSKIARPVYYRHGHRLLFLLPVMLPLLFAIALVFFAFHARSVSNQFVFLLAAAILVVVWAFTPLARGIRWPFCPAFVVREDGILLPRGVVLKWSCIRDAVVFSHCGHRHLGFRLKDGVRDLDGKKLDEVLGDNLDWSIFQMPLVVMLSAIRIPSDELFRVLQAEYGLAIHVIDGQIELGSEKSLSSIGVDRD